MQVETTQEEREQRLDELVADYLRAAASGSAPDREELLAQHPDLAPDLSRFFADQDAVARLAEPLRQVADPATSALHLLAGWPAPRRERGRPAPALRLGGYEILEELGRGGMGVVFKARQTRLDRLVALKIISPAACPGARAVARFQTEAQAAARLAHPNVVGVFEVGEYEGLPYLALELVEGGSLAQRLGGTPVPARQAARLIEALARAAHAAHRAG